MREEFPEFHISLSSRVNPEIREYERTSTTVANAYVQPLMEKYLRRIEGQLKERGFRGNLYIMLSSGGITSVSMAEEFPIRLCESGPAAGALVSSYYAQNMGIKGLDLLRHGWDDGQDLPDPGWQAFSLPGNSKRPGFGGLKKGAALP